MKLLYFCLNTFGLSSCVIDRRDGKFSVKGIKVPCLVSVCSGFQQEGNSEFLGPATTISNPCRGVIIGRVFLSKDEWMHFDPSSITAPTKNPYIAPTKNPVPYMTQECFIVIFDTGIFRSFLS